MKREASLFKLKWVEKIGQIQGQGWKVEVKSVKRMEGYEWKIVWDKNKRWRNLKDKEYGKFDFKKG